MTDSPKKDKSKDPKVFDVAKPGKSAPAPTSKPIIITNRPVLKDPMMSEGSDQSPDEQPTAPPPVSPASSRVKIVPLSSQDDAPASETPPAETEEKAAETPDVKPEAAPSETAEEPTSEPTDQPATAAETPAAEGTADPEESPGEGASMTGADASEAVAGPTEGSDEAAQAADSPTATDASAESAEKAATDKEKEASKEEDEAARKEAARAEELRKLAESHRYYLPIDEVEKRHRIYAWSVLLVLVLGAVWLDIVLDAGIMKLGNIKAPTHFFSVQQPAASSPTTTAKLYVSTTDHISFSYPGTWKLDKLTNNGVDEVEVAPSDPTILVSAALVRNPVSSTDQNTPATQITLGDVTYQKLKSSTASAPLYLQQLIAEVPSATNADKIHYVICYSITTAQLFKTGDTVSSINSILGDTFTSPNGKDQLAFYGEIAVPTTSPSDGPFTNLSDAENFVKSNQNYKQLMIIMQSLKLPKQHT